MNENDRKIQFLIQAITWNRDGLVAEDTSFNSRSNYFLTLNSLLAIAFVGIFQKGFSCEWKSILILGIPIFSLILNIIWAWLGVRTMLAFKFYFLGVDGRDKLSQKWS